MNNSVQRLKRLQEIVATHQGSIDSACGENTVTVPAGHLIGLLTELRDDASCRYEQLIDLCGVDYSTYGGQAAQHSACLRFAVVYHLLSVTHNQRLRVVANVPEEQPVVASVVNIWAAADWFEREAFDLFGILFEGHPDLRRILTDYGFIGHPFRKDFPLSGHVEMRFDEEKGRVVYEPVSIEPRVSVPRVIRRGLARD